MIDTARKTFNVHPNESADLRLIVERHESGRITARVVGFVSKDTLARVELSPHGPGSTLRPEQTTMTASDTATPQDRIEPHSEAAVIGSSHRAPGLDVPEPLVDAILAIAERDVADLRAVAEGWENTANGWRVRAELAEEALSRADAHLAEARQQRDEAAEHAVKLKAEVTRLKTHLLDARTDVYDAATLAAERARSESDRDAVVAAAVALRETWRQPRHDRQDSNGMLALVAAVDQMEARPAAERAQVNDWRCRRCGSLRWVAASRTGPIDHGGRAIKQCVPCGHYSSEPVAQDRP